VAVLLLGVVIAVELRGMGATPRSASAVSAELLQPYDSSFVELWVRGCRGSGESAEFCRCAIDEYTTRLRPDEFETASAISLSGGSIAELPENVRRAVEDVERECR
jgi:hypothetical protein